MRKDVQEKKRMFSWMNPKLEVRDTAKYGKGIFARENIKKDEILAIFGGYIMTLKEENSLSKTIEERFGDSFLLDQR